MKYIFVIGFVIIFGILFVVIFWEGIIDVVCVIGNFWFIIGGLVLGFIIMFGWGWFGIIEVGGCIIGRLFIGWFGFVGLFIIEGFWFFIGLGFIGFVKFKIRLMKFLIYICIIFVLKYV